MAYYDDTYDTYSLSVGLIITIVLAVVLFKVALIFVIMNYVRNRRKTQVSTRTYVTAPVMPMAYSTTVVAPVQANPYQTSAPVAFAAPNPQQQQRYYPNQYNQQQPNQQQPNQQQSSQPSAPPTNNDVKHPPPPSYYQ